MNGAFVARGFTPSVGNSLWHADRLWLCPPGSIARTEGPERWYPAKIASRSGSGNLRLTLAEINSREQARALVHWELWLLREDFPPTDEDEFYMADLVGLDVVDPEGRPVGRVSEIWEGIHHDNLVILDLAGEELQVPFVEAHVADVNLAESKVILTGRPIRAST